MRAQGALSADIASFPGQLALYILVQTHKREAEITCHILWSLRKLSRALLVFLRHNYINCVEGGFVGTIGAYIPEGPPNMDVTTKASLLPHPDVSCQFLNFQRKLNYQLPLKEHSYLELGVECCSALLGEKLSNLFSKSLSSSHETDEAKKLTCRGGR